MHQPLITRASMEETSRHGSGGEDDITALPILAAAGEGDLEPQAVNQPEKEIGSAPTRRPPWLFSSGSVRLSRAPAAAAIRAAVGLCARAHRRMGCGRPGRRPSGAPQSSQGRGPRPCRPAAPKRRCAAVRAPSAVRTASLPMRRTGRRLRSLVVPCRTQASNPEAEPVRLLLPRHPCSSFHADQPSRSDNERGGWEGGEWGRKDASGDWARV